jgi:multidrug efflux pump subunit AcrA (membrane-fusion protein)
MTQRQLFRKAARIVGALIALVLLLLWFSGAFVKKIDSDTTDLAMPASAGDLRTAVVEEASVPVLEEAAGTVQAERKTLVSARIVAAIREVRVRAGEQVAAGDLLVVLDDRELSATVARRCGGIGTCRAVAAAGACGSHVHGDPRPGRRPCH